MSQKEARINITAKDKSKAVLRGLRNNLMGLKASALGATSALTGLGTFAGAAGLAAMARQAINLGSSITDMATATRTGIEELQVLTYAAREAGASNEQMANLLVRVQKSAADAGRGLSTAKDAFKKLGINTEEFIDLRPEEMLDEVGKALVRAGNDTGAYGAALDILGTRNAPKLMEVMQRLGNDGFSEVARAASEAGQIMEESTARRLDAAADAIERFKTRSTILFGEAMANLMDKGGSGRSILTMQLAGVAAGFGGAVVDNLIFATTASGKIMSNAFNFLAAEFGQKIMLSLASAMRTMPGPGMGLAPVFERAAQAAAETTTEFKSLDDAIGAAISGTQKTTDFSSEFAAYWQGQVDILKAGMGELEGAANSALGALDGGNSDKKKNVTWMDDAAKGVTGLAGALENGLLNAAKDGKKAFSDLGQYILAEIQRILIRSMVLRPLFNMIGGAFTGMGWGTLGSAFSGAFGGGYADGGHVMPGKTYLVGEKGPELLTMAGAGRVTANRDLGGGGNVYNVDMRGASLEAVQRLERFVRQQDAKVEKRAIAAVAARRMRSPGFLNR